MTKNHWNFINWKRFHDAETESLNLSGQTENPLIIQFFFLSQAHSIIMPLAPPQFFHPTIFTLHVSHTNFHLTPILCYPQFLTQQFWAWHSSAPACFTLNFFDPKSFLIKIYFDPKIFLTRMLCWPKESFWQKDIVTKFSLNFH